MSRLSHYSWFDHPNNIWWGVQLSQSSTLCSLLCSRVTSSLLRFHYESQSINTVYRNNCSLLWMKRDS
jgi:hypothetical protein